jgi:hypothetical protein
MYIVKKDENSVDLFANQPHHGIDWLVVGQGRAVTLLSAEDYQKVVEWQSATVRKPGAPARVKQEGGKPVLDDNGDPVIEEGATPDTTESAGNIVRMIDGGDVWLVKPKGKVVERLHGTVIVG